mmetsp:Transcript_15725/g.23364  ORF Transcript_15725/g.23364 Transcript_15725/m.23364 type:complete len:117 (+) Transcript_15725:2189-2539(+)
MGIDGPIVLEQTHSIDHITSRNPQFLLFGGDSDITGNYLYDDLWIFTWNETLFGKHLLSRQSQQAYCDLRHGKKNPSAISMWNLSCGEIASNSSRIGCRWEDIILLAWCNEEYQSL